MSKDNNFSGIGGYAHFGRKDAETIIPIINWSLTADMEKSFNDNQMLNLDDFPLSELQITEVQCPKCGEWTKLNKPIKI